MIDEVRAADGNSTSDDFYAELAAARAADAKDDHKEMDPVVAGEQAKLIAREMQDLMAISAQSSRQEPGFFNNAAQIVLEHAIKGTGKGDILLLKDPIQPPPADENSVDKRTRLVLWLHTDPKTAQAAEALDPQSKNKLGTIYYFDQNGNHEKAVLLTGEIEDERENIGLAFDHKGKAVNEKMSPEDFELAGTALQLLRDKLTVSSNQSTPVAA